MWTKHFRELITNYFGIDYAEGGYEKLRGLGIVLVNQ
jgi:hypothetical protein